MANAKIIEKKALVVDEIKGKFENAKSVVVFDPRGLSVAEVTELRRALRESGSDYKVYKNTLAKRAVNTLDIKLDEYLEGPSAISFSSDELAPVKVISEFAKKHDNVKVVAGLDFQFDFTHKKNAYALTIGVSCNPLATDWKNLF